MFEYNPVPKTNYKRKVKKQRDKGKFSSKTIKEIFERDNYRCVKCGSYHLESVPHHIVYRSHGGEGTKRNGATVCRTCHRLAHSDKETRKWFESWQERMLDDNGDLREMS
jgi:5-methylcytosine-specific restriction endonuclease McrA